MSIKTFSHKALLLLVMPLLTKTTKYRFLSLIQPLDSNTLIRDSAVTPSSSSVTQCNDAATPETWLNRLTHRWSIHQKIAYGYVLSLGIAVLGTGTGLIVGNYFESRAVEKFTVAQERHELMGSLEQSVLQIKLHQQRTVSAFRNQDNPKEEIASLIESLNDAKNNLSKLKANIIDYQDLPLNYATNLKSLLNTYDAQMSAYTHSVQSLAQQVDRTTPASSQIQTEQKILDILINGKPATKLEQLSENLEILYGSSAEQMRQAKVTFKAAKALGLTIIVSSMALSIAIAAALALYTSRAIAHPLQAVTDIAKRVTEEGDYHLKAPVISEDEVGVLANSLNQLIERVAKQIRELQQAQGQLIQSEKMSSLGQMVAGVAHEINNPVNFIYGNLEHANTYAEHLLELIELYQQYYSEPIPEIQNKIEEFELEFIREDLPQLLCSMHMGAERIRQIVLTLRNFSHLDEAEKKPVDIHEGIENTLLILLHRFNEKIEIIKHYGNLPLIECYPAQLNQAFMNIISNAIDALEMHPALSNPQIVIQSNLTGEQIEVRIKDNGLGIKPEIKDKIFDPFFTTKPVGKGTGMGLAISYQIIEKHQGTIEVFSVFNQGTEFVVTLPIKFKSKSCSIPISL
ncbi:MAG TPA: ATP-binding protein [Allocoleopsis sp.]